MSLDRAMGVALVVAGAVLVVFLPHLEVLWFQGRPLGIVLIVIGAIEVASSVRTPSSGGRRRSLGTELRDEARELRDDLR